MSGRSIARFASFRLPLIAKVERQLNATCLRQIHKGTGEVQKILIGRTLA